MPPPSDFWQKKKQSLLLLKALYFKLPPRIFKPSYGPKEEEERKEALTLAHIRVHIFVSNLRKSVTEDRTQTIECGKANL